MAEDSTVSGIDSAHAVMNEAITSSLANSIQAAMNTTSPHPASQSDVVASLNIALSENKTARDASDEVQKTSDTAPEPSLSKSDLLQKQIQALTSRRSRVLSLRSLPAYLLIFQPDSPLFPLGGIPGLGIGSHASISGAGQSGTDAITSLLASGASTSKLQAMGSQAQNAFQHLNEVRDELLKNPAQEALKTAHESEEVIKSEVLPHVKRERKKLRIASADSPAPLPSFQLQSTSAFPAYLCQGTRVTSFVDLLQFIREYNAKRRKQRESLSGGHGSGTSLEIWMQTRPRRGLPSDVSDPLVVRVAIHDVAIVFVKMTNRGSQLAIESVVALGPREKKSPYSHSDFVVYQKVTQQVTRMIEREPNVSLPQLVDFLSSYEDLFMARCSVCHRVMSEEGHIPPVARVWVESADSDSAVRGRWDPQHTACFQV